ncbi:DUF3325 family protein [Dongia rigui]|uniref:DUF3325 family protein n=1 Tax=Dongia rigui TaxID=940149 RepID=A0ABU5E2A2_9PROT|nr:DUF3325 family protein [Dongia rigui]MDY0873705.1 DUF3325 family protein [Dongia rigui]
MSLLAATSAAVGFMAVALAMQRHAGLIPALTLPWRRRMRAIGGILLALSLGLCLMVWPVKMAWVAWLGLLTTGALAAVLLITWRSGAKKTPAPVRARAFRGARFRR